MADYIQSVAILGTGLIGASIGLALRSNGFAGAIAGWDRSPSEAATAQALGAIDFVAADAISAAAGSDCIVLAAPVFGILEWIERLAPLLRAGQLVTDVGSTKQAICGRAAHALAGSGVCFLAGHPMAGKEVHGAANAEANLFRGAVWLFTPDATHDSGLLDQGRPKADEWRRWVERFGCRIIDLDPQRHDEICAWASHLPQMLGTALGALLEESFPARTQEGADLRAIGGRAMREMTRLGASPFSMWRDIAHTNQEAIAAALLALEQRLAYLRENLNEPALREEFERANRFRSRL